MKLKPFLFFAAALMTLLVLHNLDDLRADNQVTALTYGSEIIARSLTIQESDASGVPVSLHDNTNELSLDFYQEGTAFARWSENGLVLGLNGPGNITTPGTMTAAQIGFPSGASDWLKDYIG